MSRFASAFFSAIQNLHNSISAAGLRNRTKVTTPTIAAHPSLSFPPPLLGESYPPSHGFFNPACQSLIAPVISFLVTNHSLLLVNICPYFSYSGNTQIPLNYVHFPYLIHLL
ncbi:hypothetical protein Peur_033270 [Populus x canadensis]